MKKWHHVLVVEFDTAAEYLDEETGKVEPVPASQQRHDIADEINPANGICGNTWCRNTRIRVHQLSGPFEAKGETFTCP